MYIGCWIGGVNTGGAITGIGGCIMGGAIPIGWCIIGGGIMGGAPIIIPLLVLVVVVVVDEV